MDFLILKNIFNLILSTELLREVCQILLSQDFISEHCNSGKAAETHILVPGTFKLTEDKGDNG